MSTIMIGESFSQCCPLGDSTPDYGYGDDTTAAAPTPDYGYGDTTAAAAPTPDYGYGDTTAAPDTAKLGYVSPDSNDLGYGDTPYSSNDLGYGNTEPDNQYGYGNDNENDQQQEEQRRRERPRRRGSITKYSLDAQHEVQEYEAHQPHAEEPPTQVNEIHFDPTSMGYGEAVVALYDDPPTPSGRIRKSRKSQHSDSSDAAVPPLQQEYEEKYSRPMSTMEQGRVSCHDDGSKESCGDGDATRSHDGDVEDGKKKKKKKKGGRFSILRLGRNLSHGSKDSSKLSN
jgi:hypothetical protein